MKWSRLVGGLPAGILISARILRKVPDVLHLPDAVLPHVLVLVDAAGPGRGPSKTAEHRHDVPAALRRLAVGGERHDRLHGYVRVYASVREAEASASDLLQEQRANPLAIERALRVVPDAGVGEEVREVMPQTQLCVMAVGVLEALDRRDGFDALGQRLEQIDALLQRRERRRRARTHGEHDSERDPCPANASRKIQRAPPLVPAERVSGWSMALRRAKVKPNALAACRGAGWLTAL